jgi:lipopolysaccharide transport system ATP-binding protein
MIGIVGPNGSGKSTLLRLIGGVGRPDAGSLSVTGRLGALLDLGAGLQNDLSGRDNILINGVIAGLTRRQVLERFDRIVAFAELEAFLDNPLRTYSTGMRMRLAFSVATHIDPEILLIDEILSVGDFAFQSKCLEKIGRFKHKGVTMLLVSHDLEQIEKFCDAVLWLKQGSVKAFGPPREVIAAYAAEMSHQTRRRTPQDNPDGAPGAARNRDPRLRLNENRFGSLEVEIAAVRLMDAAHRRVVQTITSGEPLRIEIDYIADSAARAPIFGVSISRADGQICTEMMLDKDRLDLAGSRRQGTIVLDIERLDLRGDAYFVDVGIYEKEWEYAYDYHWHVYPLNVESDYRHKGLVTAPHRWSWLGG